MGKGAAETPPIFWDPAMHISFDIAAFRKRDEFLRSRAALLHLLEALVRINEMYLARNAKTTPTLYESTVVYQREPNTEIWKDIPTIMEAGWGDCEDLASWRVAELRYAGIAARPYIKWRKKQHHALVLLPDGRVEDPSLALGMNGHDITRRPTFVPR
jgi:hypothetical protein